MSKAKSYLQSAYYTEKRIQSNKEQIETLRAMATSTTQTVSDMPGSPNRNIDKMEKIIVKVNDMIAEMEDDTIKLLDRKRNVRRFIQTLEDPKQRMVLECRYLLYMQWNEIALEMNYSLSNMFVIHDDAISILNESIDSFVEN